MNDPDALQRAHDYVMAAYGITVVLLIILIGYLLVDQHLRRRELADLEASGVRRRSDKDTK